MNKICTGLKDKFGTSIYLGDKLRSDYEYDVIVSKSYDGTYFGILVCEPEHSCKNIPYALNRGQGYEVINNKMEIVKDLSEKGKELVPANNCSFTLISMLSDINLIYRIKHDKSHETLHALNIAQAYRMSKLLNLEWLVCNWYNGV